MPYVLIGLVGLILVVVLVGFLFGLLFGLLAALAVLITAPSVFVMSLLQPLGFTDPIWPVLLHAALGGAIGRWAHLARWRPSR